MAKYRAIFLVKYQTLERERVWVEPGYNMDDSKHGGYWDSEDICVNKTDRVKKVLTARNAKQALQKAEEMCREVAKEYPKSARVEVESIVLQSAIVKE